MRRHPLSRPPAVPSLAALALVALVGPAARAQSRDHGDDYTARRDAQVDARGARRVEVEARAGTLRVRGVDGLSEVRVRGTARASREAWLADIKLVARREGDVVLVRAEIPEAERGESWNWSGSATRALDLVIEVPKGMAARIDDGSGDAEVRGVGALDVRDGSGALEIEDVGSVAVVDGSGGLHVRNARGDVRVSDSSGEIVVRDVAGTLTVDEDGSGQIDAEGVRGAVRVSSDGSGGIEVRDVGGDFSVGSDGSGGIDYADVRGAVSLPRGRR